MGQALKCAVMATEAQAFDFQNTSPNLMDNFIVRRTS
jgi:hypothetical protein